MPPSEAALRWKCTPRGESCWRSWDHDLVIRVGATGDTHHLSALASEVFRMLVHSATSLTVGDLAARLAAQSAEAVADLEGPVDAVMSELSRIGLVSSEST